MKVWLLGSLAQGGDMEVRSSTDGRRKEAATIPRLVVVEVRRRWRRRPVSGSGGWSSGERSERREIWGSDGGV
jgi:hypothetical protein